MATNFAQVLDWRASYVQQMLSKVGDEAWKHDHHCAMAAFDAENFVAEGLDLCRNAQRLVDAFRRAAEADVVQDYFGTSAWMVRALTGALDTCQQTLAHAKSFVDAAYEIQGIEELHDACIALQALLDAVVETWPQAESKTLTASREDMKAGRFQKAEEILNELRCSRLGNDEGKGSVMGAA